MSRTPPTTSTTWCGLARPRPHTAFRMLSALDDSARGQGWLDSLITT
ncbi:hypothetical protein [Streptomyces sp. NPDC049040]